MPCVARPPLMVCVSFPLFVSVPEMDRLSLGEGRCPSPRGAPIPRLRRRRALLRRLHSPYLLHSRVAKELLFMTCAPSCLTTTSCRFGMARGPSLADELRGVTPSGLAARSHLPRSGGGLYEMRLFCYWVKRLR